MRELARVLIGSGVLVTLAGLILLGISKVYGAGRLPGDIYIKNSNFSFYFPLATCFVLSVIVSLVLNWFKKGNP